MGSMPLAVCQIPYLFLFFDLFLYNNITSPGYNVLKPIAWHLESCFVCFPSMVVLLSCTMYVLYQAEGKLEESGDALDSDFIFKIIVNQSPGLLLHTNNLTYQQTFRGRYQGHTFSCDDNTSEVKQSITNKEKIIINPASVDSTALILINSSSSVLWQEGVSTYRVYHRGQLWKQYALFACHLISFAVCILDFGPRLSRQNNHHHFLCISSKYCTGRVNYPIG